MEKMDLVLVTVGFALGFASGYGVRAAISRRRRAFAERNRTLIG